VTPLPNGESFAVYAVDGDAVRVRVVQPGERQDGVVRLLAGLEPGTVVATTNLNHLFEGARIRSEMPGATADASGARKPKSE
jgi:multidrug efflux pump subunit AcrA (membrane-fusion protein)